MEGKIKEKRNFEKETVKKKELITGFKVNGVSLINENQEH